MNVRQRGLESGQLLFAPGVPGQSLPDRLHDNLQAGNAHELRNRDWLALDRFGKTQAEPDVLQRTGLVVRGQPRQSSEPRYLGNSLERREVGQQRIDVFLVANGEDRMRACGSGTQF